MIQLAGVQRVYEDGERPFAALSGIDLAIATGERVALVGRSGSGKTTLLHLMGGLEWPSGGRVWVDGQALDAMDDEGLSAFRLRRIGFVFQFFQLLPALTVEENLWLPAELAAYPRGEMRDRAAGLLERLGIASKARSYPERLSGGEQQRAAIARALMLEPPVLLADEPTGNLDSTSGNVVLELLWTLARERGATVVLATHSLETARQVDRIIELRDGRILSDTLSGTTGGEPPIAGAHP